MLGVGSCWHRLYITMRDLAGGRSRRINSSLFARSQSIGCSCAYILTMCVEHLIRMRLSKFLICIYSIPHRLGKPTGLCKPFNEITYAAS